MGKKFEEPGIIQKSLLEEIVEKQKQEVASKNNGECETSIRYHDRRNATVTFYSLGIPRDALYEWTESGWYCRDDWKDHTQ